MFFPLPRRRRPPAVPPAWFLTPAPTWERHLLPDGWTVRPQSETLCYITVPDRVATAKPTPTRAQMSPLWRVCLHEAGHAWVATYLGIGVVEMEACPTGGLTTLPPVTDESIGGLTDRAAVAWAGLLVSAAAGAEDPADHLTDKLAVLAVDGRLAELYPGVTPPDARAVATHALTIPGAGEGVATLTGRLADSGHLSGAEVRATLRPYLAGAGR